jgi:hypothetical protein
MRQPHERSAVIDIHPASALTRVAFVALITVIALGMMLPAGAMAQSEEADPSSPPVDAVVLPVGFDEAMVERIDEIVGQVPGVRQLDAADNVEYRLVDADTLRRELEALFRQEYSAGHIAAEDELFTRLGLIGPEDDLEELVLSLYESQVLAFYEPSSDTFSMVGPVKRIGGLESVVVAHEYGHALQDAKWDLEGTRIKDLSRSDAILAQQALAEGDATALMYDWAARELKLSQLLRVAGDALARDDQRILRRIPRILRRQLEFPYLDGYAFVNALRGRGDWAAVDEAWENRPVSSEQILHPELYPDELPIDIELPDIAATLGPDWSAPYEQTFGEAQMGVWVADDRKAQSIFPSLPAQLPNQEAVAGWGGDRLVSLDGPDGTWVVVWQTDWDSEKDAIEFRKAARAAMKDLDGGHEATNSDIVGGLSSPVLVLVADSDPTVKAVRTALGLDS